eukprot:125031_1
MEASSIVTIVYLSLYILLLFILSIRVYLTHEELTKKTFAKILWSARSIYTAVLIHLYDTATDIGVLIQWWNLAALAKQQNQPYKTFNIGYFWFALTFILTFYRIASAVFASMAAWKEGKRASICFYILLGLVDGYIIKEVVEAIRNNQTEPSAKQKAIQFAESITESAPQIILQTVFIIFSQNDERLKGDDSITLVVFSLLGSILSVANKFLWFDGAATHPKARDAQIKKKMYCYCLSESSTDDIITQVPTCIIHKTEPELYVSQDAKTKPNDAESTEWCFYCLTNTPHQSTDTFYHCTEDDCQYFICDNCHQKYTFQYNNNECINLRYLLRFVWRFSFISARFICLALICAVMGAAFFFIFVLLSGIYWSVMYCVSYRHFKRLNPIDWPLSEICSWGCILSCLTCIANPPTSKYLIVVCHWIEMIILMSFVTLFASDGEIDCLICANPNYRQASNNKYVKLFLILGWIFFFVEFVSSILLLYGKIFVKESGMVAMSGGLSGFSSLQQNEDKKDSVQQ